jgi:hypothetical protein
MRVISSQQGIFGTQCLDLDDCRAVNTVQTGWVLAGRRGNVSLEGGLSRYGPSTFARGLVFVLVLTGTEAHLDCLNWWWSPSVVSALRLTAEQSATIEREYQESLPARRRACEEVFSLTREIANRIDAGDYDDDLLHLTERLAKAESTEGEVRRRMLERANRALSPEQRVSLSQLLERRASVANAVPRLAKFLSRTDIPERHIPERQY